MRETPKTFSPVMVTPECRPGKASWPAGGRHGAAAQILGPAPGSCSPRPIRIRPSARNPLRSMIFLQSGVIHGYAQARAGGQRGEAVRHVFKIAAPRLRPAWRGPPRPPAVESAG